MIDLLYVAHNRLEFTRATFEALAANTNWEFVRHLHVVDDYSTDGTSEFLTAAVADLYEKTGQDIDCVRERFNGPVAAMNHALDDLATETLCKVDNDFLVCPGWLDALLAVTDANPELDVVGLEAGFGSDVTLPPPPATAPRTFLPAPHIGGIGVIRARVFDLKRPIPNGRFGWTQFQEEHRGLKGWLTPDLACVALDRLPFEPWSSLTDMYVERGWQRRWPAMPESMSAYWDWWAPDWAVMIG